MAKQGQEEALCPICEKMSFFNDHRGGAECVAWGNVTCATCGAEILVLCDPPPRNKLTCATCGAEREDLFGPPLKGMIEIKSFGSSFHYFLGKDVLTPISPELLTRLQRISDIAVEQ